MEGTDFFFIHFKCLYLAKNYCRNTAIGESLSAVLVLSVVYGDFRRALKTAFELVRTGTSISVCSGNFLNVPSLLHMHENQIYL